LELINTIQVSTTIYLNLSSELGSHDGLLCSIDEVGFLANSIWPFLAPGLCSIAGIRGLISQLAAAFGSFEIAASIIISERP
jgi:hypothetical protein